MRVLVVYSSRTGNTKKLADAIMEIMPEGTRISSVEEQIGCEDSDLVILGFWVDKGNADGNMKEYINRIKGKKVALFATLGAYPHSPHAVNVLERVINLVEEGGNECVGAFICQGKIDPELTERSKKYPPEHSHHMTPERLAMHEEAAKHPDDRDLENAKNYFDALLKKLES